MAKQKTKKSLVKNIKNYFLDVKEEAKKVMWTSKKDLLKYSVVTLIFILFICVFFIGSNFVIALVKGLIG